MSQRGTCFRLALASAYLACAAGTLHCWDAAVVHGRPLLAPVAYSIGSAAGSLAGNAVLLAQLGLQSRPVALHARDAPPLPVELELLREKGVAGHGPADVHQLARLLTHRSVWRAIAMDTAAQDSQYVVVLEEGADMAVNTTAAAAIASILSTVRLADEVDADIVYLGLAGAHTPADCKVCGAVGHPYVHGHCEGSASHAYALRKRRALWLWDELRSLAVRTGRGTGCTTAGEARYGVCLDLDLLLRSHGPAITATALPSACTPQGQGQYGVQARLLAEGAVGTPLILLPTAVALTATQSLVPPVSSVEGPRVPTLEADNVAMPPTLYGFVITMKEDRWQRMVALLQPMGIIPVRVPPVLAANTSAIHREAEDEGADPDTDSMYYFDLSNKYSHRKIWAMIEHHPDIPEDGYALVFEDDVALNEAVRPEDVRAIVHEAACASLQAGTFSMGLGWRMHCWTEDRVWQRWSTYGVELSRCVGRGAHAYGLLKGRAAWLYDELRAAAAHNTEEYLRHQEYPCLMDATFEYGYTGLLTERAWPVLVGSNLTDHDFGGAPDKDWGTGIFYQARHQLASDRTIG